jgi:23S rRNA-/tRNA-specific pseudouridylate synthase
MEIKELNLKTDRKLKKINTFISSNLLSIILKYNQEQLTEKQKIFIDGRKKQFIIDRYPSTNREIIKFETSDEYENLVADEKNN